MSLYLNGKQGCKVYYEGKEMCVGYMNGKKVFGCRTSSTVSDNSASLSNNSYTFKESDLTLNYTTDAPHTYDKVYLETLTGISKLSILGNDAAVGSNFEAINSSGMKFNLSDNYASYGGVLYNFEESIDGIINRYEGLGYKLTGNSGGKLTFSKPEDVNDVVVVTGKAVDNSKLCFTFRVSDNSPQRLLTNIAKFCLIPTGDINIKPIYTNTPPTIGNITIDTKYTETKVLESRFFIEDTDPRFHDAQGDQPYQLKVLSLPLYGKLYLRGVEVVKDQELFFTTDIDTGDFIYVPDNTRTDIESTKFTFTVSDTGSKTYA